MRFRPANISLINRRHYLPRLLLTLSSKYNDQNNPSDLQILTGHTISTSGWPTILLSCESGFHSKFEFRESSLLAVLLGGVSEGGAGLGKVLSGHDRPGWAIEGICDWSCMSNTIDPDRLPPSSAPEPIEGCQGWNPAQRANVRQRIDFNSASLG